MGDDGRLGLYVHLPFCEKVCPYCDFAVVVARPLAEAQEDRYVEALLAELRMRAERFAGRGLVSVYFGGGTPSLMRPGSIRRILAEAQALFPAAAPSEPIAPSSVRGVADRPELEVTLEVNPSSLERERLPAFRESGVNRLSLGVQSFDEEVLKRIGRAHSAADSRACVTDARRAGFDNLSLDLIYTAPGQTLERLEADLDRVVAFAPEHVSAYELTVEQGTPFALAESRGQLALPEEDEAVAMLDAVVSHLAAAGFRRYELLNYARPGFESVHNARYWQRRPVLGVGLGAWSCEPAAPDAPFGLRTANTRELARYLSRLEAGGLPTAEREIFEESVARSEAVFLALRQDTGLDASDFECEFGAPPRVFYAKEIAEHLVAGFLAETRAGDLRLTSRGRLFADTVCASFVEP